MTRLLASEQGIARYRPNHRRKEDWEKIAQTCKKSPGRWFVFSGTWNRGQSARIRQGALKAFRPAGHFEAAGREPDENRDPTVLWVRYVGEVEA